MELKITKTKTISTKYNIGRYVYTYEDFEIKRRKVVSIVFGDMASRLKRTRFDVDNNNTNSYYAYELTTGQIYSESELFQTEEELKDRLLQDFPSMFKKSDITDAALNHPLIFIKIKNMLEDELKESVMEELREKLEEPVKKEIINEEYPAIVEEIRNEVRKKFALTFDDFANKCLVTN